MSRQVLVLDQDRGRYLSVPRPAFQLMSNLACSEWGMTSTECAQLHPDVPLDRLLVLGLIDVVPPEGIRPTTAMVVEFAIENLRAQLVVRIWGWAAVRRLMGRSHGSVVGDARPLRLDEVEAAAKLGLSIPGTSRLCTVVAIAIARMLRRRAMPASVEVSSDPDQIDPHAYVMVGSHRVDPSDDQNIATSFQSLQEPPWRA